MKYLINYANKEYRASQKINSWTAKHIAGFDAVIEYSDKDIDADFYVLHKEILSQKRGNGLWLWKPYFILKTLHAVKENDIVFYCDSGAFFFRSAAPVFKILENNPIWLSILPLIEKQYTHLYNFKYMNCVHERYMDTGQIQAGFIAVKKCSESVELMEEWLQLCCNRDLLIGRENETDDESFLMHREDQSILSLLVKSKNIGFYQDPTQFGKLPEKYKGNGRIMNFYSYHDYKPFIILHRCRSLNFNTFIRQYLCAILPRRIGLKFIKSE